MITKASSQFGSTNVGMVRKTSESRLHKETIKHIAQAYERAGYSVKADHISTFEYPDKYRGLKPDIVAEKGECTIIVEVETPNSLGTEREAKQRRVFSDWAKESPKNDFRREVVK